MPSPSIVSRVQQAMSAGQLLQAESLLDEAVRLQPADPELRLHRSLLYMQQDRLDAALVELEQLTVRYAQVPAVAVNRGEVLRRLGRYGEAIDVLSGFVRHAPDMTVARFNLALAMRSAGRWQDAVEHYRIALEQQPEQGDGWYNLGNCLLDLGQWQDAIDSYRQALPLVTDDRKKQVLNNLGSALLALKQTSDAKSPLQDALNLDADFIDARLNLARAHESLGEQAQADQQYRRLAVQQPELWWHELRADNLSPQVFNDTAAIAHWREQFADSLKRWASRSVELPSSLLHLSGAEPPSSLLYQGQDNRALKSAYAAMLAPKLTLSEAPEQRAGTHRLRIGLVVSEGHEGIFARSFHGILQRIDRQQFEVVVAVSRSVLPRTQALMPALNVQWLALSDRVDKAADQLRQQHLDVLYHWEVGSDSFNYFLPWFKPAAVQCTSWGWSETTGIPAMDFYLSSELLEPRNAQSYYSETLVSMKRNLFTWAEPAVLPEQPLQRSDFGYTDQDRLYLCHQNPRKIHPDFDARALGILQADAHAKLLLISDSTTTSSALAQRLQRSLGDLASRVLLLPKMPVERYLSLLNCVDVALDPPHYSGANTSFDAFALGVPVITQRSSLMRANYTAGLYQQLGRADLIAENEDHYVSLAVSLANDKEQQRDWQTFFSTEAERIFYCRDAVTELEAVWRCMAGM